MTTPDDIAALREEIAQLRAEARRASDWIAIANLQATYGYYVDKTRWDQAADLFARDATLEIAGRGLFRGQDRIRQYLHALPNLEHGTVFNHMQLQPVITIDDGGETASGRWRAIMEVGFVGRESLRGEAVYENRYVREDGVWKIAKLHAFVTYYIEADKGWSEGGIPMGVELPQCPPDAPKTIDYNSFPHVFVPPYHYANPVSGRTE